MVKLIGLTALELTWLCSYGELMGALQGINTNGFIKKLQKLNSCIYTKKLAMYLKFSGILYTGLVINQIKFIIDDVKKLGLCG